MTSNDSSSVSRPTNSQAPMTYERLLVEPAKLHRIAWALKSQEWEALEEFLQMERQARLSRLEDSYDPDEQRACRSIAKWIKHFLTTAREDILASDNAERHPEPSGDPNYMAFDSETEVVPEGIEPT